MPKFVVRETVPCYVTWRYEVEAETADDAKDMVWDGGAESSDHAVGDSIEFLDSSIEVEEWSE